MKKNNCRKSSWQATVLVGIASILLGNIFLVPDSGMAQNIAYPIGTLLQCGNAPTIYYVGADMQLHAFADEATYLSWYRNFSGVEVAHESVCGMFPHGQEVPIRPGTLLVQLPDSEALYVVSAPNVLRHLMNEALALSLYGASWAAPYPDGAVYTLPEALLPLYDVGSPIQDQADFDREIERTRCTTISQCLPQTTTFETVDRPRPFATIISRLLNLARVIQEPIPPATREPIPTLALRIPRPFYVPPFGIQFNILFPLPLTAPSEPLTDTTTTPEQIPPSQDPVMIVVSGDEFTTVEGANRFSILPGSRYDVLNSNATTPGQLTLIPTPVAFNGWYADKQGPFVYRTTTGNFVVEVDVNVTRRGDAAAAYSPVLSPRGQSNSAGILIRDPASVSPGQQNWLTYGLGFELNSLAREMKSTRSDPGGLSITDTLFNPIRPTGLHGGKLRVCRIGDTFYLYHKHPGENSWFQEQYATTTQFIGVSPFGAGQGIPAAVYGTPVQFVRSGMPTTLQVGVFAGNISAPFDTRAEFDYIRFATPHSTGDCLMDLPPVDSTVPANAVPTASLTAPVDGTLFAAYSALIIAANTEDRDGHITLVEVYQGGVKIGEDATYPFEVSWPNVSPGAYTLTARVYDNRGAWVDTAPVTISVSVPIAGDSGSAAAVVSLGDEFTSASTLGNWTMAFTITSTILNINSAVAGKLAIIPGDLTAVSTASRAWNGNGVAPFIYKTVSGNFVAETDVSVHRTGYGATVTTTGYFTTGGFLLRDPSSPDPFVTPSSQNWFLFGAGHVEYPPIDVIGTVRNSTVNSVSSFNTEVSSNNLQLRVCRIGSSLYFYRKTSDQSTWTALPPPAGHGDSFVRSDFPTELQVGLAANAYYGASDITAEFDYIRFAAADSVSDCTAGIPPAS